MHINMYSFFLLQCVFSFDTDNKPIMSGQDFWREHVELPKGWMTRLSSKSNPETGIHARYYRAPDGTIFRSKSCLLKFLEDQGRRDELQQVKKMKLHRKRSFVQVNFKSKNQIKHSVFVIRLTGQLMTPPRIPTVENLWTAVRKPREQK